MNITRATFATPHGIQEFLAALLDKNQVSVFLGAGVSTTHGFPGWQTLIERMYKSQGWPMPTKKTLPSAAEQFLTKLNNNDAYLKAVSTALYASADLSDESLNGNLLLAAVGAFGQRREAGRADIVSFNFDDTLERYLIMRGLVARPITGTSSKTTGDVCIYHPHGFLPGPSTPFKKSDSIVLDQYSFSEALASLDGWWTQKLAAIIKSKFCIYIGLSGDDPRLDALLVGSKKENWLINEGSTYCGATFVKSPESEAKKTWAKRGILAIEVREWDEIPSYLFSICRASALNKL